MQRLQLDRNYRNTPEILRLAADVINDAPTANRLGVPARPEQARRGPGPRPLWLRRPGQAGEEVAILGWIRRLLAGDTGRWGWHEPLPPEAIGILYARREPTRGRDPQRLATLIGNLAPVIWLTAEPRARHRIAEPGIKLQTIHSAKGLEYRVVILIWADQLAPARQDPDDEARRLLYVGLTRARDGLILSTTGGSRRLETWKRRGWLGR
jgi:superfamily I DNA/RNA helicase